MPSPLFYWNDKLQMSQPEELVLEFAITAAKTVVPVQSGLPVLTAFDAIASQTTINNFLNTTDEFLIADFDGTAMGTDAFACIVNMGGLLNPDGANRGQAASVGTLQVSLYSGTNGLTDVNAGCVAAGLTASTLECAAEVGAYGNVAFKCVLTGVDILTAGVIIARLTWQSK